MGPPRNWTHPSESQPTMFTHVPNRNSTSYPLALANVLKSVKHTGKDALQYQQRIAHEFVVNNPQARGIILFNETGTGKTITAASIALSLRQTRDVIILANKSLQSNFKKDMCKYVKMVDPHATTSTVNDMMDAQFSFVSSNASNMMTQMTNLGKTKEEIEYNKSMGLVASADLTGKLIIVDEAHNLFNSIVSHGQNAFQLYQAVMAATDVKLIFLTATPIVNDPFELVPAFNMCAGWEVLPTDYEVFTKWFVDRKHNRMLNKEKFMNRIYGLTSYYGSWYQTAGRREVNQTIKRTNFPDELPLKVEKVHMSYHQYTIYKAARRIEIDRTSNEQGRKSAQNVALRKPKIDGASYRVHSRQACNFALPSRGDAERKSSSGQDQTNKLAGLKKEHLMDLATYSPKMERILKNIEAVPNRTQAVYSSFVAGEGVCIFAKVLAARGWKRWTPLGGTAGGGRVSAAKMQSTNTYAVFTGSVPIEERDETIRVFNSDANAYGQIIRVLLFSGAGSEGVNMYNGAAIHIMEPYWNWNRILQVLARMVRYKGHEYFNDQPNKQKVQPYLYISDYPADLDKKKIKEPTTDVQLAVSSMRNRVLNEKFYGAMIAASFDCPVHIQSASDVAKRTIRCLKCAPTNRDLFHRDITKDMMSGNPCKQAKQASVTVEELEYMGKKYYWNKAEDGSINLYEYKKSLSAYVPVRPGNTAYAPLVNQLTCGNPTCAEEELVGDED